MLTLEVPGSETNILLEFVTKLKPKKTLEVGCNFGRELILLDSLTKVYGLDRDPEKITKAKSNIPSGIFKIGEANNLPYKDRFFDLVYTDGCLSHNKLENISEIIDEMLRVSKEYVLLIEYMGTKLSANNYGNCKNNAWVYDYEKICASKDVYVCFNRKMPFGADLFQILLLKKMSRLVKEKIEIVTKKEKEILNISLGKFKLKVLRD